MNASQFSSVPVFRPFLRPFLISLSLSLCLFSVGLQAQSARFMEGLLLLQQSKPDAAFKIWKPLAESGDANAQYGLALLYENGGENFDPDIGLAVEWYQKAADAGVKEAQTNLGLLYAEGTGGEADVGQAAALWQAAAQAGHDMAQFNLGLAYYAGNGVPQSLDEAVGLIYSAADQGLAPAQFAYAQFLRLGLGVEASSSEAAFWYQEAARGGMTEADDLLKQLIADGVIAANAPNPTAIPRLPLALEESAAAETYGKRFAQRRAGGQLALQQMTEQAEGQTSGQSLNAPPTQAPLQESTRTQVEPSVNPVSVFDQLQPNQAEQASEDINRSLSPLNGNASDVVTSEAQSQAARVPQRADIPLDQIPTPVKIERGLSQGLLYGAWMGTMSSVEQLTKIWQGLVPLQPDVFLQVQAGIEEAKVNGKPAYRLMIGPFPSKSIAWQICNAVKIANPTVFCKARLIL